METCFFFTLFYRSHDLSITGFNTRPDKYGGWHLETGGLELRRGELQSRPSHRATNVSIFYHHAPWNGTRVTEGGEQASL